ncbi:MAG: S-layer homology domain-containing protein [Clostridiales bacterium]
MLKMKRIISLLVLVTFLVYSMMASFALPTTDEASWPDWAKTEIKSWTEMGLISGYDDGSFKPNNFVTRGEFVTLVAKVFNLQDKGTKSFEDIEEDDWFRSYVLKAYNAGIINGYEGNLFKPYGKITREEAAAMVVRAYELVEDENENIKTDFSDDDKIGNWAKTYVSTLKKKGFVKGTGENKYNPKSNITRAQTVVMLNNVMGTLVKKGTYSKNTKGNLVINSGNVILKDMIIEGDLYIAQGVGEDAVTLEGVTVKGRVIVKGGGDGKKNKAPGDEIKDCIKFINTTIEGELKVNKIDGAARIVAMGNSIISMVKSWSNVLLEESGLTNGKGFSNVTIPEKAKNAKLQVQGEFNQINLDSAGSTLDVSDGTVKGIGVNEKAKNAKVQLLNGTVTKLEVFTEAVVDLFGGFVNEVNVDEKAKNSSIGLKGSNVETLSVKAKSSVQVLSGILNSLNVSKDAEDTDVSVDGGELNSAEMNSYVSMEIKKGTVKTLTVANTTKAPSINIAKDAAITFIGATSPLDVSGEGEVENAKIESNNVIMNIVTKVVEVVGDVIAKIQDEDIHKDNDTGKEAVRPTVEKLETATPYVEKTPTSSETSTATATATATATTTATTTATSTTGTVTSNPVTYYVSLSDAKYVLDGTERDANVNGTAITVDLTESALTTIGATSKSDLSEIKISAVGDQIITSKVTTKLGTKSSDIPVNETISNLSSVKVSDLIGLSSVTIEKLRTLGDSVKITGTLSKSGYTSKTVTIEFILDDKLGVIQNEYAEVRTSGKTITASIISGKESTKVDDIGITTTLTQIFGEIPSYVKTDSNYVAVNSSNYTTIQDNISTLCGKTWSTLTLGDMATKSMNFKKTGDTTTEYTLTIVNANNYLYISADGKNITAKIKSGMANTKLADINFISDITALYTGIPDKVNTTGNITDTSAASWKTVSTSSSHISAIQTDISTLCGGTAWASLTLNDLAGETVYLLKGSDVYTLKFVAAD